MKGRNETATFSETNVFHVRSSSRHDSHNQGSTALNPQQCQYGVAPEEFDEVVKASEPLAKTGHAIQRSYFERSLFDRAGPDVETHTF